MKEISSGRNRSIIRGLGEKKNEKKEEIIDRGGKKEEIGLEKLHLSLVRKIEEREAGVGPDRRIMTTFPSFTPSWEDLEA
jgi:hypothetical protein